MEKLRLPATQIEKRSERQLSHLENLCFRHISDTQKLLYVLVKFASRPFVLPSSRLPPIYMLFWCRQNMETIKGRANGSTFMEISKKAFRPIPVLVPSSSVVDAFVGVASTLFDRLVEGEKQAQTLATLRDTLLPRLISGQLRLPEAEAAANAAL